MGSADLRKGMMRETTLQSLLSKLQHVGNSPTVNGVSISSLHVLSLDV